MDTKITATTAPPVSLARSVGQLQDAEMHRWALLLGTLVLAACLCVALAFGTQFHWLYGGAILFGPGLGVLAIIYLAISSDTNGTGAAADDQSATHPRQLESLPEAAAA